MIFTYCPSFPRASAHFGMQKTATYSHKHIGRLINQARCHMHVNRCIFLSVHLFIGSNPLQHTVPAYYMFLEKMLLGLSPWSLCFVIIHLGCFFHFHPVWTASALSRMSMHSLVSLLLKLYGSWGAPSNYSPGAGAGGKKIELERGHLRAAMEPWTSKDI